MNQLNKMEDYDRLARLCEAKDAEIAKLSREKENEMHKSFSLDNELSEVQAQIAMLHNFLYFLRGEFGAISVSDSTNIDGVISCAERAYDLITDEISDTQATALAYEREVKAKALEDFINKVNHTTLIPNAAFQQAMEIANSMAAELRAAK